MTLRLITTPSDRRANRLLAMSQRFDSFGPVDISGLDALALVISVYGAERLCGRGDARVSDRALRDAVRRLTAEARADDATRAERMIVALRQSWQQIPAVRQLSHDSPRAALWDRIVTMACEEFYRPSGEVSAPDRSAAGGATS